MLVLKNFRDVKPHSSEEREYKVVEVEIDNYENDEYVYYLLMERVESDSEE